MRKASGSYDPDFWPRLFAYAVVVCVVFTVCCMAWAVIVH